MKDNRITTCACSKCSNVGPVVELAVDGLPESVTLCQRCAPRAFEEQARCDIESWLKGGPDLAFGS